MLVTASVDNGAPAAAPTGSPDGGTWPVRSGPVPPLADGFIARTQSAPALEAELVPGAAVVLLPGWVGAGESRNWLWSCGKTQLAVSFAESLWQSGGVDLLIWLAATSRASLLSGYVEAAVATVGTDLSGDAESVAARFIGWLGETRRPWLVVLSDLTNGADLEGLWPTGPAGKVLVTTTNSATVSAEHLVRALPVGAFTTDEALTYLTGRLSADPDQRLGAAELVAALGCEPLALTQASAVIVSSARSCRDYLESFAQRRAQLGAPPAAAVTWTFSAEQADRLSPGSDVKSVLDLAALLDGHGIPDAVFTSSAVREYLAGDSAAEPERAWRAVLILERTGLLAIDRAAAPPMTRMSQVVQATVRAAMPDETLERAARAAADALLEVWPADDRRGWLPAGLRACAASLQQAAGDLLWADGCHPLLPRIGRSLESARLTGQAIAYCTELAEASDRLLGPDHPDTLMAAQRLADTYLSAGRTAEAVSWFRWVLADDARALGPAHPGTIAARRSLCRALVAANQAGAAVTVLAGAIADYERAFGTDHLATLGAREELAAAYRAAGQSADSIGSYRTTLADRERIQGGQHPDTMTTRQHLAAAYLADGQFKGALSHYKRVLADAERVLGPDHLDTIAARGDLGSASQAAGRVAAALRLYEQACAGSERVLGADHPGTLARRATLAHAYFASGRMTDAMTVLRDTVARCERVLPRGDPLTQAVRKSLADIAGK